MKTLFAFGAALVSTLLITSAAYAAPNCTSSFCASGGNQCTLNGKIRTCGSCMGGTTHVLFMGDLSSQEADRLCGCMHDPSKNCNSTVAPVRGATLEAAAVKTKKKTAVK